jgi:hypothetical protein
MMEKRILAGGLFTVGSERQVKSNKRFLILFLVSVMLVAVGSAAGEEGLPARLDQARCGGSPSGGVSVTVVGSAVRCGIRSETATARVRLVFQQPLVTAGHERLLLDGRGEESSALSLCIARVVLIDADGREAATYEPDILFPREWNLREILFRDFPSPLPAAIAGLDLHFWAPAERGREYAFWLRRCEVQSTADVAASLRPADARARRPLPVRPATPDIAQRWESFGPGGGGWYRVVAFSPHTGACFVGADVGGIYRSSDGCRAWQIVNAGIPNTYVNTIAFHPLDARVVFAGCNGGVLKSTDGGANWMSSNTGLPAVEEAWRLVAHPREPRTFYVGWHRRAGLFVTHDAGEHWEPLNGYHNIRSAWFFVGENVTGLDIDPANPDRMVYCNDMDLYQTLDGGRSWDQVATDCVRPATADAPAAWRGRGCEVLCMTGPQSFAVDPSDPRTLYFGYWDAHAWKSDDGGRSCYRLTNGIHSGYGRMGCVLLDPADPETVWLSIGANYDGHRLYKSVTGGREFRVVGHESSGLPAGGIFSLVLDPSSPIGARVLYAAVTGHGVYKSNEGGLTWTASNEGLPADSRNPAQIALDPRNPHRLYLAGNAHVHRDTRRRVPGYIARSDNGGQTWQIVKPRVEAQCVLVDHLDSRRILVGNRNFSGIDYPQAIYRSVDGGDTWTSVDQTPFLRGPGSSDGDQGVRVHVTGLAADPCRSGTVYASCTEHGYDVDHGRGVFVSHDWGATWEPFTAAGLANYRVGTLVVDPTDPSRLYAGTGGNGVFRFGPPP